ncbi:hypothetical protein [Clostridium sp. DJ247]|uniref:hypothetical protein n=1 Tax=Clostridium sp. DJ247 TaxID=2726188 RepID=UPI001623DE82|nr:hypothetical protein [Clostridium sp. DJ247]MBC2581052.1 hypothetical protein [Clostridium sp. DJ247]
MITSINLSLPRKATYSFINNILLGQRMKSTYVNSYNYAFILTMLCVLTNSETVFAKDSTIPGEILKYHNYFIDFITIIGYPTIDVIFNILRMHKSLIDYFKYCTLKNKD